MMLLCVTLLVSDAKVSVAAAGEGCTDSKDEVMPPCMKV